MSLSNFTTPDGQVFATGSFPIDGSPIGEITCGGETHEIDTTDPACLFGSGGRSDICDSVDTLQCDCE